LDFQNFLATFWAFWACTSSYKSKKFLAGLPMRTQHIKLL
jgi:hypothetical protein